MALRLGKAVISRAVTTLLRLASLVSKLALTLYMARFLSLADLGSYGLVFGAAMILTVVLGLRIDHVVSRELVRSPQIEIVRKVRDETIFYASNYLVLALLTSILWAAGFIEIPWWLIIFTLAITVSDSATNLLHVNLVALERPITATMIFSLSQVLWCAVAILLGLFDENFRTVGTVLTCWLSGNVAFILLCLFAFRGLPWGALEGVSVDFAWLRTAIRGSVLIWLGTVGVMAGSYVDRFVAAKLLSLPDVGVITFYSSLANTVFSLAQAGMIAVSAPALIATYRERAEEGLRREYRRLALQVALFAAAAAIAIAIVVPLVVFLFQRTELTANNTLLWLLLFAAWLRCNAECLFLILYARNQDRAIWAGNLYFVVPALAGSIVLVSFFGLIGVGMSAIASSAFLLGWRYYYARQEVAVLDLRPAKGTAVPGAVPESEGLKDRQERAGGEYLTKRSPQR